MFIFTSRSRFRISQPNDARGNSTRSSNKRQKQVNMFPLWFIVNWFTHAHTCTHTDKHTHAHIQTNIHMHTHRQTYTCTHTDKHTHAHIQTNIHMHTYMHIIHKI